MRFSHEVFYYKKDEMDAVADSHHALPEGNEKQTKYHAYLFEQQECQFDCPCGMNSRCKLSDGDGFWVTKRVLPLLHHIAYVKEFVRTALAIDAHPLG